MLLLFKGGNYSRAVFDQRNIVTPCSKGEEIIKVHDLKCDIIDSFW